MLRPQTTRPPIDLFGKDLIACNMLEVERDFEVEVWTTLGKLRMVLLEGTKSSITRLPDSSEQAK